MKNKKRIFLICIQSTSGVDIMRNVLVILHSNKLVLKIFTTAICRLLWWLSYNYFIGMMTFVTIDEDRGPSVHTRVFNLSSLTLSCINLIIWLFLQWKFNVQMIIGALQIMTNTPDLQVEKVRPILQFNYLKFQ